MWTSVVLVIDIKVIQQYFFLPSISFLGDIELNVYMEVLGGHFKSIFLVDTRYFTIAVILIAQNTNSFFDYMLVRPYSFQCKFTKCPNEHICELFCKPQNVDNLICLCKYITPSTVQCSCMHIYLYPLCWDHACTWNIWFLFQDSTVSMEKVNFKKNGGFYSNMYECCIFYLKCM